MSKVFAPIQPCQSHPCSQTQYTEVDEASDKESCLCPSCMAVHICLYNIRFNHGFEVFNICCDLRSILMSDAKLRALISTEGRNILVYLQAYF